MLGYMEVFGRWQVPTFSGVFCKYRCLVIRNPEISRAVIRLKRHWCGFDNEVFRTRFVGNSFNLVMW